MDNDDDGDDDNDDDGEGEELGWKKKKHHNFSVISKTWLSFSRWV